MFKLEILNHWIVPQQGKNYSEIDEEPEKLSLPKIKEPRSSVGRTSAQGG
jgi:hypothetical protein